MDYSNYAVLKQLGNITLAYGDGDNFGATTKHFDPATGQETSPVYESLKISDLQVQVTSLQQQIDQINQVITDAQALQAS